MLSGGRARDAPFAAQMLLARMVLLVEMDYAMEVTR